MDPIDDPYADDSLDADSFGLEGWDGIDEIEVEDSENEICDHDEHKEVVPLQEMRGASAMGYGGQFSTSEAMIVCKKCGKAKPAERVDQGNDFFGL
ncbi:hypothetical protein [Halapricum hydrolyticum]|uniref:Uncharacterized protein n=1 Tax=Halapricum hydrolyticum TaxID=2979991 RepID=A0AAE3ICS0_9EURY|nr:hypothetical protein [Halapricum hydrolyticum]MCU4718906.1 hypothetical protein [Halapricum hydrolyticum]MCU4728001.1 hypothetical protein [Halapricum hydrolyticum]